MSPREQRVYAQTQIRNIKRAKINQLQTEIEYLRKHEQDNELIFVKEKEIKDLEKEL